MKKILLFFIPCVLLGIVGCRPVNPPSNEETSAIIDLCYSSMGQSGEKLQQDLANVGIRIPKIDSTREYENYYVKNDSYELAFSTINDSVLILRYTFYFKANYVDGATKYIEFSNVVFNYGWTQWTGVANNSFEGMDKRPLFISEINEWVPTWSKANLMISETEEKPLNTEETLSSRIRYWATSVDGMSNTTDEGKSSLANTEVGGRFEINK